MRRVIYNDDHEALRAVATEFFATKAVPNIPNWERAGRVDRELFQAAGALGLLGFQIPEAFGGAGLDTFKFNAVVSEAAVSVGFMNLGLRLHADIVLPYYLHYADEDQRKRWLPGMCSGDIVTAIAMTEPQSGSDLAGIKTKAERDGDVYRLSGAKVFITNGLNADCVIVVARTGHHDDRRRGLTLLVVEEGMPGFTRGRNADKLGLHYSDTAELFFDDVEVPVANRLGDEDEAFGYLGAHLAQERMSISIGSVAMARAALAAAIEYAKGRKLFGSQLASFQNTKFVLAEVAADIEAAQQLLDRAVDDLDVGELSPADAATVKLFCTEMQARAVDRCLQIFGGYGYMREYPLADMYADARVSRIYGGSSEVMKLIISKSLGL